MTPPPPHILTDQSTLSQPGPIRSGLVNQLSGSRKQLSKASGIITQQEYIIYSVKTSILRKFSINVLTIFLEHARPFLLLVIHKTHKKNCQIIIVYFLYFSCFFKNQNYLIIDVFSHL